MIVQENLLGHGSSEDLAAQYGICQDNTVSSWVRKYNSHIELKDYDPKPEVYMADTLKVNKEKKMEIIQYCIDHDHDYKGTAEFMVEIMRKSIIGSRNMNLRVKMLWKIDAASVNLKNY